MKMQQLPQLALALCRVRLYASVRCEVPLSVDAPCLSQYRGESGAGAAAVAAAGALHALCAFAVGEGQQRFDKLASRAAKAATRAAAKATAAPSAAVLVGGKRFDADIAAKAAWEVVSPTMVMAVRARLEEMWQREVDGAKEQVSAHAARGRRRVLTLWPVRVPLCLCRFTFC